jgi:hypothetical protein
MRSDTGSWDREILVEALVVNIKHATAAGGAGLVNPLLVRYCAGGCHIRVFGVPAVQVIVSRDRLQQPVTV